MESPGRGGSDPLPACCDSGCIICVLDYPELFRSAIDPSAADAPVTDSSLDEMFEAILRAESLLESSTLTKQRSIRKPKETNSYGCRKRAERPPPI
jgi:hypothetical protein